jgi:two-component system KDP operon response regulator KdpE
MAETDVQTATILVVDDNPAVARMMARLLESKGYHAVLAADGPSALDAVRASTPPVDLVLLDMMMPDMDGLEVLRRLQSEASPPGAAPPPVIMFSAVDDPKVVSAALDCGAREYWVKASFKFQELPQRLARHLPPMSPQQAQEA